MGVYHDSNMMHNPRCLRAAGAEIALSAQVSAPMPYLNSDARAVFPNLARCDDKYR
jgi:hypothetical protein